MRYIAVVGFVVAVPVLVHAHGRLTSPPSRSNATGLQTAPCGGVAAGSSPMVYTAGSTIQVDWDETQSHSGFFRLVFSPDNVTFTNVLLDNIADPAGAESGTAMVQLPSTPCTTCSIQWQLHVNNSAAATYVSCADVRLVAPGATTTTTSTSTTLLGATSTSTSTSTTAPVDPCDGLYDFDAFDCRIQQDGADPLCDAEVVDPVLHTFMVATLRKVDALALQAKSRKPKAATRLLKKAGKLLAKATAKANRIAALGRISDTCAAAIDQMLADLGDQLTALQPAP